MSREMRGSLPLSIDATRWWALCKRGGSMSRSLCLLHALNTRCSKFMVRSMPNQETGAMSLHTPIQDK